jgi:hypothetical protein
VLVAGLASILAGDMSGAQPLLGQAAETTDDAGAVGVAARIGLAVSSLLAGDERGIESLELAIEDADTRGDGFLARVGRACTALAPGASPADAAGSVRTACEHIGDVWGAAIAALLQGWGTVIAGDVAPDPVPVLEQAAERFRELGAPVLETWARALGALALAQRQESTAVNAALKAESVANTVGVEGPKLFIYLALARTDSWHSARFMELAQTIASRNGMDAATLGLKEPVTALSLDPQISVHCFGEFQFAIDGQPVAMASMKPRTRALLRRLCADAGKPVHRDVLLEALWPNADAESGSRNLHVAISSLRQALEPGIARGASSLIVREGETYRVVLPAGSDVDIVQFDQALERSRHAIEATASEGAVEAYGTPQP